MAAPPPPARLAADNNLDPREALEILEQHARDAECVLARRADVDTEILSYLAENGAPATRAAVAANPATPASANRLLADDAEEDVRAELAAKIARLLPGLSARASEHIRALTIETLDCLARDCAVRVRVILANEIKSLDCVPPEVVKILARDIEAIVAAPILEYSPLLSDADLMEILTYARVNEVVAAVARRKPLSSDVSDAVAASLDIPAVAALLLNSEASIRAATLERIVAEAEHVGAWHVALVLRSDLSARAIRRISSFVGASQIEQLAARNGLDESTRAHLNRALRARIGADEAAARDAAPENSAALVARACESGKLNDFFIEAAIGAGQREVLILGLAALARVPEVTVRRILVSGTAKPIVALIWRAGLSPRIAFRIQSLVMKLPARELLPARGGTDFPISEKEMRWHLGYFDIAS